MRIARLWWVLGIAGCGGSPALTATFGPPRGQTTSGLDVHAVTVAATQGARKDSLPLKGAKVVTMTPNACSVVEQPTCLDSGVCEGVLAVTDGERCVFGIDAATRGGRGLTRCQTYVSSAELPKTLARCAEWERERALFRHQQVRRTGGAQLYAR